MALRCQPTLALPVNESVAKRSSLTSFSATGTVARDDLNGVVRRARVADALAQQQRRERRLRRGLEHHRAAAGQRRRELVRDEVQRKVERRDGEHGARGHANPGARVAARSSAVMSSGIASPPMRVASSAAIWKVVMPRATSTRACAMGLPASRARSSANCLLAGLDLGRNAGEDGLSLVARCAPSGARRRGRSRRWPLRRGPRRGNDAPDLVARPGFANGVPRPVLDAARRDVQAPPIRY